MAEAKLTQGASEYYFPQGSRLPFFGSISLFTLMAGVAATLNGAGIGGWILGLGLLLLFTIIFLVLFFRSYRGGIILEPKTKYQQWPLIVITSIGFMTISILPARLGEFTRPLLVKQKSGISISSTMATIVVERVFDLLTLMVILGMVILMIPLPPEIFKAGLVILIIVLAVFMILLLLVGKKEHSLKILNILFDKLPGRAGNCIRNQLHAFIEGLEILPDVKKTLYVHRVLAKPFLRPKDSFGGIICATK